MATIETTDTANKACVYAKLFRVQQKLRVPKDRKNSFGGYVFRNAADILEKAKPYLDEVKAIVVLSDRIRQVGTESRYTNTDPKSPYSGKEILCTSRYYVEATALFIDIESGEFVEAEGQAREDESKKGMDAAQLTGACSSYARKYALCGLFAIDDSRLDPDDPVHHKDETTPETSGNRPVATPKPSTPTATPPAKKSPQSGSNVASALKAKAKEAWTIFKDLDSVKSMDENSRSKFFFTTLKSNVGKEDPAKLTAEDWDKVIADLDTMRCI